jgi:squalene synthase HpnC
VRPTAFDPDVPVTEWAPDDAPAGPWQLEGSYRYCERIATERHESFPVASKFIPSRLRPSVWAIYAFARIADDFADEPRFEGRRDESLDRWERLLERSQFEDLDHPVFLALRDTVRKHQIPVQPFHSLMTAFRMDMQRTHYRTGRELLTYVQHAANPVGQLMLFVHGHREPDLHRFSDEICSALALANVLQDLSVDLPRGRHYLPVEDLVHFGVRESDLEARHHSPEFKDLMRYWVARVRAMFMRGRPLVRRVGPSLAVELDATIRAGERVLSHIESLDFEVLDQRPSLERRDVAAIAARSLLSAGRRLLHAGE